MFIITNALVFAIEMEKCIDFPVKDLSQNFKGFSEYKKCIDFAIEIEKHFKIDENRVCASGGKSV